MIKRIASTLFFLLVLFAVIGVGYIYMVGQRGGVFNYANIRHLITDEMRAYCPNSGMRIYAFPEGELGLRYNAGGCSPEACTKIFFETNLQYMEIWTNAHDLGLIPGEHNSAEKKALFRIEKQPADSVECTDFNQIAAEESYVNNSEYCLAATRVDASSAPHAVGGDSQVLAERFDKADLFFRWSYIKDVSTGEIFAEWRYYYATLKESAIYSETPVCGNPKKPDLVREVYAFPENRRPLTAERLSLPDQES